MTSGSPCLKHQQEAIPYHERRNSVETIVTSEAGQDLSLRMGSERPAPHGHKPKQTRQKRLTASRPASRRLTQRAGRPYSLAETGCGTRTVSASPWTPTASTITNTALGAKCVKLSCPGSGQERAPRRDRVLQYCALGVLRVANSDHPRSRGHLSTVPVIHTAFGLAPIKTLAPVLQEGHHSPFTYTSPAVLGLPGEILLLRRDVHYCS
jgi:hypothetical protein